MPRASFRHPPLELDGVDRGANVALAWNFHAAPADPVRIVLYLHGWASEEQARVLAEPGGYEALLREKTREAGFARELPASAGPMLAIVPRGMPSGGGGDEPRRVDFRGLTAVRARVLVRESLRVVEAELASRGLWVGRLVLIAHSAGGAGMRALLADRFGVDGVACLDSTYGGAGEIVRWLRERPRGEVRVLVSAGSMGPRGTEPGAREIASAIAGTERADRRVEQTSAPHGLVATYARVLAIDMSAELGEGVVPLASVPEASAPRPPAAEGQLVERRASTPWLAELSSRERLPAFAASFFGDVYDALSSRDPEGSERWGAMANAVLAHVAIETDAGKALWNWNFGNIHASRSETRYAFYDHHADGTRYEVAFRAYRSSLAGVADYVDYVARRAPHAWSELKAGGARYLSALRRDGYWEARGESDAELDRKLAIRMPAIEAATRSQNPTTLSRQIAAFALAATVAAALTPLAHQVIR